MRLYSLLKQNRWTEDPFLHRRMRKQWQGGRSHVTNRIVADAGACTTKVWQGRAWVCLQDLARSRRIIIPLKGTHLPSGTLRIILQDSGRVAFHHAVDEGTACSTRACGPETLGVDKGCTEASTDSDGERHSEGLDDLLFAESDQVKAKGRKRNQLHALEAKHREPGARHKANNIRNNSSSRMKADQQEAGPTPRPWVPWDQWAVIVGICLAHRHRLPERATRQQSLTGSREEVPD